MPPHPNPLPRGGEGERTRILALAPFLCLLLALGWVACGTVSSQKSHYRTERQKVLRGTLGTYNNAPRKSDGRVDVERLAHELNDINANTYNFLIWHATNDWADLGLFLPLARKHNIRVWATIVPPSESPPRTKFYSEPFRLNYVRWGEEFARLSLKHPNLVAWSIDDFTHNLKATYTPAHLKQMLDAQRAINPRLAFVPCCYLPGLNASFATNCAPLLDGVLFPYRNESRRANLTNASFVEFELEKLKEMLGADFPIVLDIYATPHSQLGATTPEYVEAAMQAGLRAADGVMIYCHQDPQTDAAKYQIIKRQFGVWAQQRR